jgi:hypothetical protein
MSRSSSSRSGPRVIPRERLINKLRELNYTFRTQTLKSQLWRKKGGTHCVWLPRKENPLSETYVRNVLRQCGVDQEEIERFIGQNRCH